MTNSHQAKSGPIERINMDVKPLDLLIDQFIEEDIRFWIETKQREAEQIDLFEEEI